MFYSKQTQLVYTLIYSTALSSEINTTLNQLYNHNGNINMKQVVYDCMCYDHAFAVSPIAFISHERKQVVNS